MMSFDEDIDENLPTTHVSSVPSFVEMSTHGCSPGKPCLCCVCKVSQNGLESTFNRFSATEGSCERSCPKSPKAQGAARFIGAIELKKFTDSQRHSGQDCKGVWPSATPPATSAASQGGSCS